MFRHFICLLLLVCSFILSAGEIYLLQTTDLHGIMHDIRETGGASSVVYSVAKDAERLGRDKTLVIDCGDLLQGSLEAAADKGGFMIELLNTAKYDVWVPGNHDFEFGREVLTRRINRFKGDVLAANLIFKNVKPYRIFRKNGYKIAVIGMTHPHLDQWLFRPGEKGFHILPIEVSYRKIIQSVMKEKPDAIILAIHTGIYPSKRLGFGGLFSFARRHPEAMVILGGHTHEKIVCKELGNSKVCYFQAGAHGGGYIRVKLSFNDSTRKLEEISGEYVPVAPRNDLPKAYRAPKADLSLIASKFPARPSQQKIAEIFGKAIMKAYPHVKGVFHGALTSYRPKTKKLNRGQLFLLCPYENKVLIAHLNKEEFNAILEEQKENEKFGMKQFYFPKQESENLWEKDPQKRYPFAFNSYVASGAGGRFPVLKAAIEKPGARAYLIQARIFDLTETYIKEVYK